MPRRKEDPRPEGETEMAKESGIVTATPATARVRWAGPGMISIGGVGDLQPGQAVELKYGMAIDLARSPGFTIVEDER